jgi:hypothetical protein
MDVKGLELKGLFLHFDARSARRWLWVLVGITLLNGLIWAAMFPAFMGSDELLHLGYSRDIARQRTLSVPARDYLTSEEVVGWRWAEIINVSGFRRPVNVSPARLPGLDQLRHQFANPELQPDPEPDQFNSFFSRHHPPFYYGVTALPAFVWQIDYLSHLYIGRIMSVLFLTGTLLFAYGLGKELFPNRPIMWIGVAALVTLLPMVTYQGATYTNQVLETTCFTALFWMLTRILRRGLTTIDAITLGLILAFGLWTKVNFLIALPLVGLVFIIDMWSGRGRRIAWLLVVVIPMLIAGPWYIDYIQQSRGGLADARPDALTCPSAIAYARDLPVVKLAKQFWMESLGNFGHRDSPLPQLIYTLSYLALGMAVVGWARHIWVALTGSGQSDRRLTRTQWQASGLFLLSWLGIYLFYWLMGYLIACDMRGEYTQGRLVIPIAAAYVGLILIGWFGLWPNRRHHILAIAVLLSGALSFYALLGPVANRYFGSQTLLQNDDLVVLSNPLTEGHSLEQCVSLTTDQLNRIDIWLDHPGNTWRTGELNAELRDGSGQFLASTDQFDLGWGPRYPAFAEIAPIAIEETLCINFAGTFDASVTALASDQPATSFWQDGASTRAGRLAVGLYESASWLTLPKRVGAQTAAFISPVAIALLLVIYFALFPLLIVLLSVHIWRSGADA